MIHILRNSSRAPRAKHLLSANQLRDLVFSEDMTFMLVFFIDMLKKKDTIRLAQMLSPALSVAFTTLFPKRRRIRLIEFIPLQLPLLCTSLPVLKNQAKPHFSPIFKVLLSKLCRFILDASAPSRVQKTLRNDATSAWVVVHKGQRCRKEKHTSTQFSRRL